MIRLFFALCFSSVLLFGAVTIDREKIELLPYCEYIIIDGSSDSLAEIERIEESSWKRSDRRTISLGFKNSVTLWVRCSLKNPYDKRVMRVLETDNPKTEYVTLYYGDTKVREGRSSNQEIGNISPYFKIYWEPQETKTVYISFRSPHFSLDATPILWQPSKYVRHENLRHVMLGLFFGAMAALLIYNLFIFLFTKDSVYIWYCGYIFLLIMHQLFYTRIADFYIRFSPEQFIAIFHFLTIGLTFFISNFTRHFLNTEEKMPLLDKVLKYLTLYALVTILSPSLEVSILILLPILPLFIIVALRALMLGLHQAKYYAAGWIAVSVSWLVMAMVNFGFLSSITNHIFIPQLGFVFEALIFSIGLADRINTLKAQKEEADRKLISYHKFQHEQLQTKVEQRTLELSTALREKSLLLKEVHHRVKNNLQMITSLIQLQAAKADNEGTKEILRCTRGRIAAIGTLHEILYRKDGVDDIDSRRYFEQIVSQLRSASPKTKNVSIELEVTANLDPDRAIYCGLILNELVTNALKHAFDTDKGEIRILLEKENGMFRMAVSDNGKGFEQEQIDTESVGLALVKALSVQQLKGSYTIESNENGTVYTILFPA